MKTKREGSDVDKTPQKNVKVEGKSVSQTTPMKWTVKDAKLIQKLRDEKVEWKEIAKHVPGVQHASLRSHYAKTLKGLCDTFTDDEIIILKGLINQQMAEHKKRFWADVGARMGKSGAGCEKTAKEAKIQMPSMY